MSGQEGPLMPNRTPAAALAVAAVLFAGAGTAFGQTPAPAEHPTLAAAAAVAAQNTTLQPAPAKKGKNPVIIGALIGAVGAAAFTAMFAAKYGENETGGFCGACFAYWAPLAVPAGAGIGAGVGWIIKAGAPGPQPTGQPSSGWRQESAVTIRF